MSLILEIKIYECDGCRAVLTAETPEPMRIVGRQWYLGLFRSYCPKCKNRLKYQSAITADETQMGSLILNRKEAANV